MSKEKRDKKYILNLAQIKSQHFLEEIAAHYAETHSIPEEAAVKQVAQHEMSKKYTKVLYFL